MHGAVSVRWTSDVKRTPAVLLRDALELPPETRASLAGSLIESLETEVDEDSEAAWSDEISRRIREVEEGKVALLHWSEVRRRLLEG